MARVMKGKRVKIYAVNSHTLKNKIESLRDVVCRRDLDFSEAGLEKRKEPKLKGYTAFRADHEKW